MLKYRLRHLVSSSILIKYKLWPKWLVDETSYGRTGVWTKRTMAELECGRNVSKAAKPGTNPEKMSAFICRNRDCHVRVSNYVQSVVGSCTEYDFHRMFRLSRTSFQDLCQVLQLSRLCAASYNALNIIRHSNMTVSVPANKRKTVSEIAPELLF
jgi:hypothetical protein